MSAEWRDKEMDELRAHHAEIDNRSQQATMLIRKAYQTVGQQPSNVIPLGETDEDPAMNTSKTINGKVIPDNSKQANGAIPPVNIANQSLRQPGASVFNRLGTTHDLRNDLKRRRGVDNQLGTPIVQPETHAQIPAQNDSDVTQIGQNAKQMATIDKSWTKIRNRGCHEFWNGLQAFLAMASEHKDCDGRIRCPCVRCINSRFEKIDRVRAHVFDRGFMQGYDKWIYHGEPEDVVDDVAVADIESEDEMIPILEDFFPPTTEDVQGEDEQPTTNPQFDDLFEEIEAELYPGCDWISSLNFLAKLLHLKVRGKIPNNIFEELLKLLKFAFPKENNIPSTYYEAKKRLKKLGLGYDNIDVCLYNCCLFYKENASKEVCPVCRTSRWVTSENGKGKKVPCKVMRYFPLTPRLKRLYSSRITAKSMIWHHTGKSKDDGVLRHPVDGLAWKDFDAKHSEFARDPRNVRLGLAADGFNPFGNMSLTYSMWPVVVANYNLPPWLCMKDNYFLLSTLIPGAKCPGKDMDIFLRPLVDELKELWNNGVATRDSSTNSMFTMRAALLWTVNDFPARSSLSGWSGQGYKACPTCNEDTTSIRVIGKTSYVGHRRFLPSNHAMRRDTRFDGKVERRPPPR
ncbi:uncharacterized protein LOC133038393 [Cannabis sativa]|uniref:uncharacterized protein LOC133038393 n=1 Tax=Cannabis sativa TaxID=3483 RepID=UPI0029C9B7B0|nr:uncharacterized protein LOC133038393 [Cannabis sativa]